MSSAADGRVARVRRGGGRLGWTYAALPGLVFLAAFFVWPFIEMTWTSLQDTDSYRILVESSAYRRSMATTFMTAGLVTLATIVLGYPYAYAMYRLGGRWRSVLGILVLLPFATSLLIRSYAWTVWLQDNGIINKALLRVGLIDAPLDLIRTTGAVTLGMAHALLPFLVYPLFATMTRVPRDQVPAAISLGASRGYAFRRVFFPQTITGVFAGAVLVFTLALGYYITPALLGSPQNGMISELIVNQVQTQLNFGVGAALGVVLLAATVLVLFIATRFIRFETLVAWRR